MPNIALGQIFLYGYVCEVRVDVRARMMVYGKMY